MSNFDPGANSSPGLGFGRPSLDSHLQRSTTPGNDPTQQPPIALPLVNLEGRVDVTLGDITHDNAHRDAIAIPASDRPSLGLGDYQVPESQVESTHTGNGGLDDLRSLIEPYADDNVPVDNVSASGRIGSSLPTYGSNVCFTSRFVICQ